ncbi:hypothetical protein OROHE_016752 [Orobanche hederae]
MDHPKAPTLLIADGLNWEIIRNPKAVIFTTILTIICFGFALCMKRIKGTDIPQIVMDCVAVLIFIGMLLRTLYVLSGDEISRSYESSRREEELIKRLEKKKNSAKFVPHMLSINNTPVAITNTKPAEVAIVMPPIDDTWAADPNAKSKALTIF